GDAGGAARDQRQAEAHRGEGRRGNRLLWNNQAPETGVRRCDPPGLAAPSRQGHNRSERNQATPRKMAALPAVMPWATSRDRPRRLRGARAANFRVRGSRSISFSAQRAGIGGIRINRRICPGTIRTDYGQIRHAGWRVSDQVCTTMEVGHQRGARQWPPELLAQAADSSKLREQAGETVELVGDAVGPE